MLEQASVLRGATSVTHHFKNNAWPSFAVQDLTIVHGSDGAMTWQADVLTIVHRTVTLVDVRLWNAKGTLLVVCPVGGAFTPPATKTWCRWEHSFKVTPSHYDETARITFQWTAQPPIDEA